MNTFPSYWQVLIYEHLNRRSTLVTLEDWNNTKVYKQNKHILWVILKQYRRHRISKKCGITRPTQSQNVQDKYREHLGNRITSDHLPVPVYYAVTRDAYKLRETPVPKITSLLLLKNEWINTFLNNICYQRKKENKRYLPLIQSRTENLPW